MLKVSTDCHIKTCRPLKRKTILKISSKILYVSFKTKRQRKPFSSVKTKPTQILT